MKLIPGELGALARELRRRLEDFEGELRSAPPAAQALEALAREISTCRRCPLGSTRLNAVPGVGSTEAQVLFIGEGPGYEEDRRGEPFVGKSGQLLDRILASIGLSRRSDAGQGRVFIANIVKCHPMKDPSDPQARANDRPPTPEEIAACRPYLERQIQALSPRVIVTLGAVATQALLGTSAPLKSLRGRWRLYEPPDGGAAVKVLPTFHPAALLRDPALKAAVWEDMKSLRRELSGAEERT